MKDTGRFEEAVELASAAEALARQRGSRDFLVEALLTAIPALAELGRWDEAVDRFAEAAEFEASERVRTERVLIVQILVWRGESEQAHAILREHESARVAEQVDIATTFAAAEAALLLEDANWAEARAAAERGLAHAEALGGLSNSTVRACLIAATEAALAAGDLADAEQLLDSIAAIPPGHRYPIIQAHALRLGGRLDAARGRDTEAEEQLRAAEAMFEGLGLVVALAIARLDLAEFLVARGRAGEAADRLAQARATFEALGARSLIERLDAVAAGDLAKALP